MHSPSIPRAICLDITDAIGTRMRCRTVHLSLNEDQPCPLHIGHAQIFYQRFSQNLNLFHPNHTPPIKQIFKINAYRRDCSFALCFAEKPFSGCAYHQPMWPRLSQSIDPSRQQYTHLYSTHSPTLSCPYSKISVSYAQFPSIRYTMHHLCSSVFVIDQIWQDFFPFSHNNTLYYRDFRSSGAHVFQSSSMFCQMTNRTIAADLARLYSSQYVTTSVTSAEIFQSETQATFDLFVASITNDLLSTLRSIRDINHVNALFAGQYNNYCPTGWILSWLTDVEFLIPIPLTYSGCICSRSSTCAQQATMYDTYSRTGIYGVSGLYTGCSVTEAILQSTLECFYSQTCLGKSSIDVNVLDQSLLVRFSVRSTDQELVNYLMVERWNFSSSFDSYYRKCHPEQCTYTEVTRNDAINVVTTLFGLIRSGEQWESKWKRSPVVANDRLYRRGSISSLSSAVHDGCPRTHRCKCSCLLFPAQWLRMRNLGSDVSVRLSIGSRDLTMLGGKNSLFFFQIWRKGETRLTFLANMSDQPMIADQTSFRPVRVDDESRRRFCARHRKHVLLVIAIIVSSLVVLVM